MHALAYAVASMAFAAVNDLVFKKFADGYRPVGLYMAIIGVFWFGGFAAAAGGGAEFSAGPRFWGFALAAGVLSATANVLLIEGLSRNEAGVCAAVYRLNLVPAALMAFVLLGERITAAKLAGIGFAVGAVLCFASRGRGTGTRRRLPGTGLWLVVLAALLRAGMGIAFKQGIEGADRMHAFLAVNGGVWIGVGLVYQGLRRGYGTLPARALKQTLVFGVISGGLVCGIVGFMALALQTGDASAVLPVMQLSFVLTAVAGMLFMGESCTVRKTAGLALAVLCILFMGFSAS